MKPRVLVLTSTLPRHAGDSETPPFVLQLCTRLNRSFDVDVLAPHAPGASRTDILDGVRVMRYRYAPTSWQTLGGHGGILAQMRASRWRAVLVPLLLLAQFWAVRRLLRGRTYHLIHAHWLLPQGLLAAVVLKFSKMPPPLVVTAHGSDVLALRSPSARTLRRWVVAQAAAVTAVSAHLRDALAGEAATPVRILPMGVDLRATFCPNGQARKPGLILFVGRLLETKGVKVLLDAMTSVLATHPHALLWLVGSGADEITLRRQAADVIGDRVRFLGPMPQASLVELYRTAEVVVFPSIAPEGLGLVLIEALGCECAVVASDLAAVRETVVDGVTGLLARPGDPAHLASQLCRLLDEPTLRTRLGVEGRQHVLRFDWAHAAQGYADLFGSLIQAKSRR